MATVDTSIYATSRPKSAFEHLADMDAADAAKQAKESNRLALLIQQGQGQDQTQARERGNKLRMALQGLGAGASDDQRIGLLESHGEFGQADTLRKGVLDRQRTGAQVQKDEAEAEKVKLANMHSKLDRHLQGLATVATPQDAMAWLQEGVKGGTMDMQKASALAGQLQAMNPQQLQGWKQQMAQGGLSLKDQVEQHFKQLTFDQNARNDLIGPDGGVNQPLLSAKQQVAKAGASSVSVNTGQKGFDNTLKLRGDFRAEPVYKAHQEMQSAHSQIQQSLKQASPAGDLAGATKMMKLLDPGSVVRESELGMAMAASGLMDRVTNYAQNIINGTKLTPTQRKDFQRLADALYSESVKQYNTKRGEYEGIATRNGLNVPDVLGEASAAPGGKVIDFGSLK